MRIRPFAIECFYERWEFAAELMLSSSDCESRPIADVLALEPDAHERLLELRLGYTEVPGSLELRTAVASPPAKVTAAVAAVIIRCFRIIPCPRFSGGASWPLRPAR